MKSIIHSGLLQCIFLFVIASDACSDGMAKKSNEPPANERTVSKSEKIVTPPYEHSNTPALKIFPPAAHQKKPLTKNEKEALRRQVNEAEQMYVQEK